jgi:hypothetical protein
MKYPAIHLICRLFHALCLALLIGIAACATGPRMANHAFWFDGYFDKWSNQVDLLEYSYGDQYRMVRDKVKPPRERLRPQALVSGTIPIGEFLYVKWRIKATGEVREDRVDLRPLLLRDMNNTKLTFVIDDRQLYIYLVTDKPRDHTLPQPLKTFLSVTHITYELYPNNTLPR